MNQRYEVRAYGSDLMWIAAEDQSREEAQLVAEYLIGRVARVTEVVDTESGEVVATIGSREEKSGKEQAAKAWKEACELQLSRPPVLTNAETPRDETEAWARLDAICAEHGLTEEDLEEIAENVF